MTTQAPTAPNPSELFTAMSKRMAETGGKPWDSLHPDLQQYLTLGGPLGAPEPHREPRASDYGARSEGKATMAAAEMTEVRTADGRGRVVDRPRLRIHDCE